MIVITLRYDDQIEVSKKTLTDNGTVFKHLVDDLGLQKLDIEDFAPASVKLFVGHLRERKVENIENPHFRELHKLSVVFDVSWLIDYSRGWLKSKISEVNDSTTDQMKIFLFEECFYIYNKWNLNTLMDTLVLQLRFMANSAVLSHFVADFETLKTDQISYLLHLAGQNTRDILKILIHQIGEKNSMDESTRYLLQNVNLPLCIKQDEDLYQDLFDKLRSPSFSITVDDLKMALGLANDATQHLLRNPSTEIMVHFAGKWFAIEHKCDKLMMVNLCISEGLITSMYDVIEMSAHAIIKSIPTTEEIGEFVEKLENLDEPLERVSTHYVEAILKTLQFSARNEKSQLIRLLEMIKENEKLSTKFGKVQLIGQVAKGSSPVTLTSPSDSAVKIKTAGRRIFKYIHPAVQDCGKKGDCGFMIKFDKAMSTYDLLKDKFGIIYRNAKIHTHDNFEAGKMSWYVQQHGQTTTGEVVTLPKRWKWGSKKWWNEWFKKEGENSNPRHNIHWMKHEMCIDYDITDFLVAKSK